MDHLGPEWRPALDTAGRLYYCTNEISTVGPAMGIRFNVLTGMSTPIYRQIVEQVHRAVAMRELAAGGQLPSVRALAEQLVVNPNTVARAYSELARDGVIEGRPGKGFFVGRRRRVLSRAERRRRLDAALDSFVNEAVVLDFTSEEIRQAVERKLGRVNPSERASGDNDDE